jgi:hypothetical protein
MKIDVSGSLDKGDVEAIKRMTSYSFELLKSEHKYVAILLASMQDMNWPIAHIAADYLKPHANELVIEINEVFKTNDATWIYWMIIVFFINTDYKLSDVLVDELLELKKHPSKIVIEEISEVLDEAIEHLKETKLYPNIR